MPLVKPLIDFQNILSVTTGGRFGIFVDDPMDALKIHSVVGTIQNVDPDCELQPTVIVPTYPYLVRGHDTSDVDFVYTDPQTGATRILYNETLHGPIQGIPWIFNRAVILPTYLHETGATQCFDVCFVFCEQQVGVEVIAQKEPIGTETVFISTHDLRNHKL